MPLAKDITSSILDTKTYELKLLNDKIVFDVFEVRQEQNEKMVSRTIFAIITVKYHSIST